MTYHALDDIEIWDGMPNQTDTIHEADLNEGGVIDMPELMVIIARWKASDDVTKSEVEGARYIWFTGVVY